MSSRYPSLLFLFLFTLSSLFLWGEESRERGPIAPVQVELLNEQSSIQPGRPFWLALRFRMDAHWHVYWKNPGQSGMATEVYWELPEGFTVGELQWPAPIRFESEGIVGYGYEDELVLLAQVTPPEDLRPGSIVDLQGELSWVACHDQCVPGDAFVKLTLPVSRHTPRFSYLNRGLFKRVRAALPQPLVGGEANATEEGVLLALEGAKLSGKKLSQGYFFVENGGGELDLSRGELTQEGSLLHFLSRHPQGALPPLLKGILRLEDPSGAFVRAYLVEVPLHAQLAPEEIPLESSLQSEERAPAVEKQPEQLKGEKEGMSWSAFLWALAGAFVGGLILNLMPCVLPVISLKILGFVKMAEKESKSVYFYGLSFTAGVMCSYWLLSGVLIALQASGEAVGWGFQLQEPSFVAVLMFVLTLVGLNFFGVYEVGTSITSKVGSKQGKSEGLMGAFSSGVLATALATPCTGPFLGTAVGLASTLSPLAALTLFSFIGLGMSSPYLLLSAFPSLLKFLPKPGNWMIAFKQSMGFIMLATVIWLSWVFTALTSPSAIFPLLGYLLLASFALWVYGYWATPLHSARCRRVASCVALLLVLFSVVQVIRLDSAAEGEAHPLAASAPKKGWERFSKERFDALRAEGKPIFIDFTARWCLICQTNKLAMHDASVEAKLQELGVVPLEADWTRRDPEITHFLKEHERNGVPLYLLFSGDGDAPPQVLPQNLTPGLLLDYLSELEK